MLLQVNLPISVREVVVEGREPFLDQRKGGVELDTELIDDLIEAAEVVGGFARCDRYGKL